MPILFSRLLYPLTLLILPCAALQVANGLPRSTTSSQETHLKVRQRTNAAPASLLRNGWCWEQLEAPPGKISTKTTASLLGKKSPCLQLQPKALLHCEWTCPLPNCLKLVSNSFSFTMHVLTFTNIQVKVQLQWGLMIMPSSVMWDSSCQFQQSRVSSERDQQESGCLPISRQFKTKEIRVQ